MKNNINRLFITPKEYVEIEKGSKEGLELLDHLKKLANDAMKNYNVMSVVAQVDTLLHLTDVSQISDDVKNERSKIADRDMELIKLLHENKDYNNAR